MAEEKPTGCRIAIIRSRFLLAVSGYMCVINIIIEVTIANISVVIMVILVRLSSLYHNEPMTGDNS